MRRLSPSTLRQRVLPPISRTVLSSVSPASSRALQTSTSLLLPRSTSARRTFVNSAEEHHDFPPPTDNSPAESSEESPTSPDVPSTGSSQAHDFYSYTTSVIQPAKPSSPLPAELGPALTHLYTSFLPGNQHLAEELHSSSPFTHVISFPDGSGRPRTDAAERPQDEGSSAEEAVVALTSPFEGGEAYVADAVKKLASEMDAEVLRIDLLMALGLDGPASPLGSKDASPPPLPLSLNPLYLPAPRAPPGAQKEVDEAEEGDDKDDMPGMAFTSVPIAVVGGGGMAPPGLSGLPGMGGPEDDLPPGQINLEWVHFFTKIINSSSNEAGRKRIIVLESAITMSKSFPLWWPSFVEAVRRRRKGSVSVPRNGRVGKGANAKTPQAALLHPTSIVLQCTPSIALPHTTPAYSWGARDEDGALRANEEGNHQDEHEHEDPAKAAIAAIEEKFKSMGINVQSHVEVIKPKNDGRVWWGSEESDMAGRREGDKERLSGMLSKGVTAILPSFGAKSVDGGSQRAMNPLRRLLMNRFGGPSSRAEEDPEPSTSLVWKAYPIIPQHRNFNSEKEARIQQRRIWSAAILQRAVHQLGGVLVDPLEVLTVSETTGKPLTRKTESSGFGKGWGNMVVSWADALHLSSIALGTAARAGQIEDGLVSVKWQDIVKARKAMKEEKRLALEQIKRHLPSAPKRVDEKTASDLAAAPQQVLDPVVEHLKKSKSLSQHEKRLLPCIVDPAKLASTSFKNVHLPEKTVDGIRSMVSLPLLFPEAFKGGVLKDHATTGALLFGPPGTGKTLLARAVAAESGARMLAIQPSDVNDMYVGEGEKLVKAVFNLARRLSPCVVFLDEVDALFGARISRGSAGSMSHNLLLTEFMQEMDGLSSAIANKDKRVVVIGATNRPFDLDDAVLRRLPRRLLVDLPDVKGRKAILQILLQGEQLAEDVDLDKLAQETDGFSGSDLKHLCVSAALSAVKDTVQVPWAQNSSAETGLPAHGSSQSTPSSGLNNEVFVYATPDGGGGGGRKKAKVTRQKTAAPVAQAEAGPARILAASHTQLTMSSDQSVPDSQESNGEDERVVGLEGEGEGDHQLAQGEVERLLNANKMGREPSSESGVSADEDEGDQEASTAPIKPRVVAWKHFKVALTEIRPSSSEEGSLPELRKWSEQFGEGGSRKGKKSGFGKGFGFSEEKPKDRESGYGRVKQDDE